MGETPQLYRLGVSLFFSTILPISVIGIMNIVILSLIGRTFIRRKRGEKAGKEESYLNLFSLLIVFNVGMVTAMLID